jgi:hypothetical protein
MSPAPRRPDMLAGPRCTTDSSTALVPVNERVCPAGKSASARVITALDESFISHVLPLEGLIHAFLRRHGDEDSEIPDLR